MTTAGWIIMIGATGGMTLLLAWCIYRVIKAPDSSERIHSPVDIETDEEED